jgi:hypothetical protein
LTTGLLLPDNAGREPWGVNNELDKLVAAYIALVALLECPITSLATRKAVEPFCRDLEEEILRLQRGQSDFHVAG